MFEWTDGAHVVGTRIWCDAPRLKEICFLSRALLRLRFRGDGARVITTARTLALRAKLGLKTPEGALVADLGRPFALGRLRLELLPSGRMPGAAQLLVEMPGRRVLYAGEVNARGGRTVEEAQVRGADAVAVSVAAAPAAQVPEVAPGDVVRVEVGPGAAEVAVALAARGLPLVAHRRVKRLIDAWAHAGVAVPEVPAYAGGEAAVALWPADAAPPPGSRVADATAVTTLGDLASVVAHVEATGAREVWLLGAGAREAAPAFVARGLRVHPLAPPRQLSLIR